MLLNFEVSKRRGGDGILFSVSAEENEMTQSLSCFNKCGQSWKVTC